MRLLVLLTFAMTTQRAPTGLGVIHRDVEDRHARVGPLAGGRALLRGRRGRRREKTGETETAAAESLASHQGQG